MKFISCFFAFLTLSVNLLAQGRMTEDLLWSLGRVSGESLSQDGKYVYYTVTRYDPATNKSTTQLYISDLSGRNANKISEAKAYAGNVAFDGGGNLMYAKDGQVFHDLIQRNLGIEGLEYSNFRISPGGRHIAFSRSVKIDQTKADRHPDLPLASASVYDDLMFRHWNVWEDGAYNHIFIGRLSPDGIAQETDIMPGEAYDSPTVPFGGAEDLCWSKDGKWLAYVCVKKKGKDYAVSTNSDIYLYHLETRQTQNASQNLAGYDKDPQFSPDGKYLAWLSMSRDGYESDKNDLIIMDLATRKQYNVTRTWDETINHFIWSPDSRSVFCNLPYRGSIQLFEIGLANAFSDSPMPNYRQISHGDHDYASILGVSGDELVCTRNDMNHAPEVYAVNIQTGQTRQITRVNDEAYQGIRPCPVEKHWIRTSDKKNMLAWVIFPPDFDPTRKYPTLLYCQGGPQSALTQFYSFRWNFQLMASKGYIVVAPNRRGMPGWGRQWNEQISGDWGGQCISDYLSAIDQVSKKPYVDVDRRAAVGASFGGYSVFMLAGLHENRFKTFISHCGSFNLESWYGSTEEMWFANWDLKGPYWNKKYAKAYQRHSPHRWVHRWNRPILIIQGGRDYRIPDTQAFEAFTAAKMLVLPSRLLYFPDEGHHVLKVQNGLLWQREFFTWLRETL